VILNPTKSLLPDGADNAITHSWEYYFDVAIVGMIFDQCKSKTGLILWVLSMMSRNSQKRNGKLLSIQFGNFGGMD
jgi:hypothetical protein